MAYNISQLPPNGTVFWSYPSTAPDVVSDVNRAAARRFCDEKNAKSKTTVFGTMEHLPEHSTLSFLHDGCETPKGRSEAGNVSRKFAQLATGSSVTVAVDYSGTDSWFRKNELPVIMARGNISHIRRLSVDPRTGEVTEDYLPKDEWLAVQARQWWSASLAYNPKEALSEIYRLESLIKHEKPSMKPSVPCKDIRRETFGRIIKMMYDDLPGLPEPIRSVCAARLPVIEDRLTRPGAFEVYSNTASVSEPEQLVA